MTTDKPAQPTGTLPAAPPAAVLTQMINGYWVSQALYAAAKLGIADIIGESGATAASIAAQCDAKAGPVYRLLRALASVGVFAEKEDGCFVLTPPAELLRSEAPASLRGMALLAGDPLPPADVLVMGLILHDWSLEEKRLLLRKAHAALPDGGALIVYDNLIDDERRANAFGLLMSLNMLIETPAGFDYTGADCQGWMREAGFRETYVEYLVGPTSMVVGIR